MSPNELDTARTPDRPPPPYARAAGCAAGCRVVGCSGPLFNESAALISLSSPCSWRGAAASGRAGGANGVLSNVPGAGARRGAGAAADGVAAAATESAFPLSFFLLALSFSFSALRSPDTPSSWSLLLLLLLLELELELELSLPDSPSPGGFFALLSPLDASATRPTPPPPLPLAGCAVRAGPGAGAGGSVLLRSAARPYLSPELAGRPDSPGVPPADGLLPPRPSPTSLSSERKLSPPLDATRKEPGGGCAPAAAAASFLFRSAANPNASLEPDSRLIVPPDRWLGTSPGGPRAAAPRSPSSLSSEERPSPPSDAAERCLAGCGGATCGFAERPS
eukprot:363663-Chlamydomonas_euryale.AAC.1